MISYQQLIYKDDIAIFKVNSSRSNNRVTPLQACTRP